MRRLRHARKLTDQPSTSAPPDSPPPPAGAAAALSSAAVLSSPASACTRKCAFFCSTYASAARNVLTIWMLMPRASQLTCLHSESPMAAAARRRRRRRRRRGADGCRLGRSVVATLRLQQRVAK